MVRRGGLDPALLRLWRRLGSNSSHETPSLGTSIRCECGPKNAKKIKIKKKEKKDELANEAVSLPATQQ